MLSQTWAKGLFFSSLGSFNAKFWWLELERSPLLSRDFEKATGPRVWIQILLLLWTSRGAVGQSFPFLGPQDSSRTIMTSEAYWALSTMHTWSHYLISLRSRRQIPSHHGGWFWGCKALNNWWWVALSAEGWIGDKPMLYSSRWGGNIPIVWNSSLTTELASLNTKQSDRLYFLGFQNHCRQWLQPWN